MDPFASSSKRQHVVLFRPKAEHKFDPESGQVFSETEVRFDRKNDSNGPKGFNKPNRAKKIRPNLYGARSLADMASIKVASQIDNLTPDHFVDVPWSTAEKIWEWLKSMGDENLHAWRILATAYPRADEFGRPEFRYHLRINHALRPIAHHASDITSENTKWLTILRLAAKQLSLSDLVSIHTITNLAVLDLSDGQGIINAVPSPFDERVMRSWAQVAASGQSFQHLRVMMFGWQDNLSGWIFKYLDHFPSLCWIIVTDCGQMHQRNRSFWEMDSQAAGWDAQHSKKSVKTLRSMIDDRSHVEFVSGYYYKSMELFSSLAHSQRPNLVDRLPVLEVSLGSPRGWFHIVEDFPGNRTIFFENTKTRERMADPVASRGLAKRMRNKDSSSASQETRSPPAKRGSASRPRPARRSGGKSVGDLLDEFRNGEGKRGR